MSATIDTPQDEPLDLRRELARIDRDRAETQKLLAETKKLFSEQAKLNAEASKLGRDRWLAPLVVTSSVIAAIGGAPFLWRIIVLALNLGPH